MQIKLCFQKILFLKDILYLSSLNNSKQFLLVKHDFLVFYIYFDEVFW